MRIGRIERMAWSGGKNHALRGLEDTLPSQEAGCLADTASSNVRCKDLTKHLLGEVILGQF